jgi:hypothetical protein
MLFAFTLVYKVDVKMQPEALCGLNMEIPYKNMPQMLTDILTALLLAPAMDCSI